MRQIRDMSILEIDITNSCHKRCSNCTRFCGHHKKPFFMDFEIFKRAVDSLEGFGGLVSTIGGEPLLHPDYPRFAEYLRHVRSKPKLSENTPANAIVKDYLSYVSSLRWAELSYNRGKGYNLFSSLPANYYKSYENIQEVITNFFLNDHSRVSMHQPILISRKDLGIGDEEFAVLRDNCWLQNFWSASITPKGCFFCEVAGTLDMLFAGEGGKPIEPGWWERDISAFSDQFHWCDICGMALRTFSRSANDEIDDASRTLYEKLKEIGTPKFKRNQVHLVTAVGEAKNENGLGSDMASVMGNYQPVNEERVADLKENMRPDNFIELPSLGLETAKIVQKGEFGLRDWLFFKEPNVILPDNFFAIIKERCLNPGYLFVYDKAILFSPIAKAVKRLGFDGLRDCTVIAQLVEKWSAKVHVLRDNFENIPDMDIPFFRGKVFADYDNDNDFKERLSQRIPKRSGNILVLQSAFVFHTLSIARLLENAGYNAYVISSGKFKDYMNGWIADDRVTYFSESHFNYAAQNNVRERAKRDFIGAIVPFSFGASTVKPIDDYTDALRTAEDTGGKILGIINIRREFIEPEYDIWSDVNA